MHPRVQEPLSLALKKMLNKIWVQDSRFNNLRKISGNLESSIPASLKTFNTLWIKDSRVMNLRKYVLGILNLESHNIKIEVVPILSVFNKILGKAFREIFESRIFNPVVKYVRGIRTN